MRIRQQGWRQGAYLEENTLLDWHPQPAPGAAQAPGIAVILSQDCDLIHSSPSGEPWVEALIARQAPPDGNLAWGRNPRRLQFEIEGTLWEADCNHRCRFSRRLLADTPPKGVLPVPIRNLITAWIAKRYTRPAFPDTLNNRLRARQDAIRRLFQRHGSHIQQVLLAYQPSGEADDTVNYSIILTLVMTAEDHANHTLRTDAEAAVAALMAALQNCPGIDLLDCYLRSEVEVTLDDLRFTQSWDFDHLTHRQEAIESGD